MNFAAIVNWGRHNDLRASLSKITFPPLNPTTTQSHGVYIGTKAALSQWPQPLVSMDGRFALVSDARIDNRKELFSLLHKEINPSSTISDGELILAAYQNWGNPAQNNWLAILLS